MEKQVASFRLDQDVIQWLDTCVAVWGVKKGPLVEDALRLAADLEEWGTRNRNAIWAELARRYGDDALLTTWVTADDDGAPKAHVRIDGKEPADIAAEVRLNVVAAMAHVFFDVDGLSFPSETTRLGLEVLRVSPMRYVAYFPWPPDPAQTGAVVQRLGDLARVGVKSSQEELLEV